MTTDPYTDPNCDQDALDQTRAIREAWKRTQPDPTCFEDVVALCKRWATSPEAAECRAITAAAMGQQPACDDQAGAICRRLEQHSLVLMV